MKKLTVICLCATLIVNFFGFIIPNNASCYITHSPIYIDGNAAFTPANGVTGGSGTQSDPYLIEGWDIKASSTIGIYIRNTNAYFIISNCYVHDGCDGWRYHDGIYLRNVQNGRIENTILLNNDLGIQLRYSYNSNILNNTVSSNCHGILLSHSSNNNISNNSISSNRVMGIWLIHSSNNKISNNSVSSNTYDGISLWHSNNNNIFNNDISNNYIGICLDVEIFHGSSYNNIYNNNISNNLYGIYLYYSSDNTIHNNSILGNVFSALYSRSSADTDARYNYFGSTDQKQVEKLVDCDYGVDYSNWLSYRESNVQYINTTLVWTGTVVIDKGVIVNGDLSIRDATIIFANFYEQNFIQVNGNLRISNSSIRSNCGHYTVLYLNRTNGSIINSDLKGQRGLSVHSEEGISVQMSNLNSGYYGIVINKGKNVTITNCNILSNRRDGIYISRSCSNDIYNNNISNNYYGIDILYSSNNNICNNNVSNNGYGIYLWRSSNNEVCNNKILNNGEGIFFVYSPSNNIYNNNISNNFEGISLRGPSNNIYNNIISSNYWFGIYAESAGSIINNNEINDNFVGICLGYFVGVIKGNTLSDNFWGIYVGYGKIKIFHNNFINNTNQAHDERTNYWDDGYPSGGNYWSDNTGIDEKSGPNQDQPGSDGIGDTPYNITGGTNKDRYPLMYPWGKPRISVEKEFIPSEIMTISQGVMSSINITNIGDVNITSMDIIDEYVENMRPNDPAELLVTITSDEGEIYAVMPEDLDIISTENDITISFDLPLEIVPVYWENGMLQFSEELYHLESIPKDWTVGVQYLLYPIAELEMGTYTADVTVIAYGETGKSTTETATGMLTVSLPIEPVP